MTTNQYRDETPRLQTNSDPPGRGHGEERELCLGDKKPVSEGNPWAGFFWGLREVGQSPAATSYPSPFPVTTLGLEPVGSPCGRRPWSHPGGHHPQTLQTPTRPGWPWAGLAPAPVTSLVTLLSNSLKSFWNSSADSRPLPWERTLCKAGARVSWAGQAGHRRGPEPGVPPPLR